MPISLEEAKRINPNLNPKLFLPDPRDVLRALDETPVKEWLEFIAEEHVPPVENARLVFVPCAAKKPYDPPRNILHRKLIELEKEHPDLYFVAVSEPLALEPREYWNFKWRGYNLIYDAPFFPWIERYGYKWDEKIAEEVWRKLSLVAEKWYRRNRHLFRVVICYAAPGSSYRRILSKVKADYYIPDKEPSVEISYEENVERIYTHPYSWSQLLRVLEITKRNAPNSVPSP